MAIDKATFDSVQCGTLPRESIADYCKEVQRVLKVGGKWIVISHAPPEIRHVFLALQILLEDDRCILHSIINRLSLLFLAAFASACSYSMMPTKERIRVDNSVFLRF